MLAAATTTCPKSTSALQSIRVVVWVGDGCGVTAVCMLCATRIHVQSSYVGGWGCASPWRLL
jgi:hypothetical protein